MRTLTVLSRKGGVGKTTVSVSLALTASQRGLRVVLADVDPLCSASYALRNRSAPGPGVVESTGGKLHQLKLASLRQGVDLLLIDTPGTFDTNVLQAIHIADLCLLVTRPNYLDLAGAVQTAKSVQQLMKPGLVVLNHAPSARSGVENPLVRRAREALLFTRMPLADTTLRARAAFETSVASGRSVQEQDAAGLAAQEMDRLWIEVAAALGLASERRAAQG